MNQLEQLKENLKEQLRRDGATDSQIRALEVGSNHKFSCKCGTCRQWWRQMGPEEDGSYGPFTKAEIDGPTMDEYTEGERLEYLQKAAEAKGDVEIVIAAEDELLLDLDTEDDFNSFVSLRGDPKLRFSKVTWWCSSSGNRHVRVKLDRPEPVLYRIALQALLFSDRKREMLSLLRVVNGVPHPVVLFKPRGAEEVPL